MENIRNKINSSVINQTSIKTIETSITTVSTDATTTNETSFPSLASKPVINLIKTGQNIKRLRIKSGLSVKDIQEIFNFSYPQAIYAWQDGKTVPSIDNLIVLSRIFRTSIENIIETDEIFEDITEKSA